MDDIVCEFFEEPEFGETYLAGDDLFAIFESLDGLPKFPPFTPLEATAAGSTQKDGEEATRLVSQKSTSSCAQQESETEPEPETSPKSKRQKLASLEETNPDGQQRMSHITVERNRRKQMNEHLSVLRALMPSFYVKRGDQASIIEGVVDYINELQQVLQSLEAKKQRKVYSEVLSPRIVSSPRPLPLSPRKPPLSPRLNLPISPRTPQPGSPYKPRLQQQGCLSPTMTSSLEPSPTSSTSSMDNVNELVANSKSPIAHVEVKFSGPNLLLKTLSPRIPGQAVKIISALEDLSLEILHVNITTIDETILNSFTIKIGIECQLSAEELAHQIQQTFC
ncbi:transcription factor SPEECHLESS-like [Durio zibethinus]|uniref:Transcription factor SPEECHLESS-like n=1 Tax=Durio zibethinus TaxID=66656 RepID=A0A6P6B9Z8_DURZI|nr:transcription factor SPEECHLESS-like [Durio zibethinus]